MPRVPAHLCEHALGMLQGGMRTADVARAINCNAMRHLRQRYRETGRTADRPRSGRPRVTTPAQDRYIRTPAEQVQDGNNNCLSYTRNLQSLHQCSDCPQ